MLKFDFTHLLVLHFRFKKIRFVLRFTINFLFILTQFMTTQEEKYLMRQVQTFLASIYFVTNKNMGPL